MSGFRASFFTVVALSAGLCLPLPPAVADGPLRTGGELDEAAASDLARERGVPVEVTRERTERTTLHAMPDGSFSWRQSTDVIRVRSGDGWVRPDPTIVHRADGSLGPSATTYALSLSDGGDDEPLAKASRDGGSISISWPAPLPAPSVAGSTATYSDVLPGVDLVVTATADAFSEVLVVKSRAAGANAALRKVVFPVATSGLSLRPDVGGGFSAVDGDDRPVFVSPEPLMWDSRGATHRSRHSTPQEGDRVARMRVDVSDGAIGIAPDAALLADPATTYPVYLDPWFDSPHPEWTVVDEYYPTTEYYKFSGDAGVGYQNYSGVSRKRQYHEFDVAFLSGRHIQTATFSAFETHAATCTPTEVELWETGGISAATNWSNQPSPVRYLSSKTVSYGRAGCPTPDPTDVEFGATPALVDAAAAGKSTVTFRLMAGNESDPSYWKRFSNGADLIVAYNSYPDAPTGLRGVNPPFACATGTAKPYINSATPIVAATVDDDDNANVRAEIDYGLVGGTRYQRMSNTSKLAGSEFQVTIPDPSDPAFENNRTYSFRARGWDGLDYGAYSVRCEFVVDTVKPSTPAVTSSIFVETGTQQNPTLSEVGVPGTFTLSPGGSDTDVDYYKYGFDTDVPTTKADPADLNDSKVVSYTPLSAGPHRIVVNAYDRAGNQAMAQREYWFTVVEKPKSGWWRFNDAPGLLADSSSHDRTLTLTGDVASANGRAWGAEPAPEAQYSDHALQLDGSSDWAGPGATILNVNSGSRFTASAWVRLDGAADRSGTFVAVSENGTNASAFQMGYTNATWFAEVAASDSATAAVKKVAVPAMIEDLEAGTTNDTTLGWVRLTATYDGTTLTLHVNASNNPVYAAVGTAAPASWATPGTFRIGAGRTGSSWHGRIDEVVTYPWNVVNETITRL